MTNYREKYLRKTIDAINVLIGRSRTYVDCKDIRKINKIKSSNRSATNFIWRSLHQLESQGYLKLDGRVSPRLYEISSNSPIDIKNVMNKKNKSEKKV